MAVPINFSVIPEAIQDVLEKNGITEAELSDRSGVPQPVLNRLARGEGKYPSLTNFSRLWPFIGDYLIVSGRDKPLQA